MARDRGSNCIAVIGDIVSSRQIAATERGDLQERLMSAFERLHSGSVHQLSPFTITLGDEFQAVYDSATDVFPDVLGILATAYPHSVRFSFGLGTIVTAINPRQAIGMDGPAFHTARNGIDDLKKRRRLLRIGWLHASPPTKLADDSLDLLSHLIVKWNRTRLLAAEMKCRGHGVPSIAAALGVSRKTVYKTTSAGALSSVVSLLAVVASLIDRQLTGTPLETP